MSISIGQAARAVGVHRTTILRAIKTGKLSARFEDGAYRIDPAELHRVYPDAAAHDTAPLQRSDAHSDEHHHAQALELAALRAENVLLRESLDDARRRLDAETEERRRLTHVLEDMRPQTAPGAHQGRNWSTWAPAAIVVAMLGYAAYTMIWKPEQMKSMEPSAAPAKPAPESGKTETWTPDNGG